MSASNLNRRAGRSGVLLAFFALIPAFASAQTGHLAEQPILAVEFQGLEALTEETLLHYLFGPSGPVELDLPDLDQGIHRLWNRGLVDDLQITAEPVPGGVRLLVRLVERPILVAVEYQGLDRVQRVDILERVDRERIAVYENQPLQKGELKRLEYHIEELYREKGFRFAKVNHLLEEVAPGQRRAVFTVDEGDKVKIGEIAFDGNIVFSDWKLRQAMKKTREAGVLSRFSKKNLYNPAHIEEDLRKVRDVYRQAGYKDVLLADPELEVREAGKERRRLAVTIPIEEGERWKFGEVSIMGNEVFSDQLLLRQFEVPRGGWLRSQVVEEAVEKITNLYSNVGYVFARVESEIRERTDQVADVVVRVEEADQYRVGRVEFEGNEKTIDKVLRRELRVQEGTLMNMSAIQNSLLKIRQLDYFTLDEAEPVAFDFDAEEKEVNLRVRGEEADRTELQFGGGWGEGDGFFGQAAMRTRNFLGRGETLGASVQLGSKRTVYDLEYGIPWFLDRPQNLGFRVFSQNLSTQLSSDVDQEETYSGASLTYGRSFRGFHNLQLSYSFAEVRDIQRLDLGEDAEDFVQLTEYNSSSIRPVWSRNTLDSRFAPTRGTHLNASLELAGGILGGDTSFLRPRFSLVHFSPVSRRRIPSSFGVKLDLGYITSLDDNELFPSQRFTLGGDNSVRGFDRRSIAVRREDGSILRDANDLPIGGDYMLRFSAEYHLDVGGPFRLVAFGDAGGVFADASSIDLDLMSYSAGLELRIQVPLFPAPLRFIYATNLDPKEDLFKSLDFSLSASF